MYDLWSSKENDTKLSRAGRHSSKVVRIGIANPFGQTTAETLKNTPNTVKNLSSSSKEHETENSLHVQSEESRYSDEILTSGAGFKRIGLSEDQSVNPKIVSSLKSKIEKRKRGDVPKVKQKKTSACHTESDKPTASQRKVSQLEAHPLDNVHAILQRKGAVHRKRPLGTKRGHRSIRFRWAWVPYNRSHITKGSPKP